MRLLFKIFRSTRHFFLGVLTLIGLWGLSMSDKLEVLTLGVIANQGIDFFTLFSHEKGNNKSVEKKVEWKVLQKKWDKIDREHKGVISQKDAINYLSKEKKQSFFNRFFYSISSQLDFQNHFTRLLLILIVLALTKAFFLFFSRFATQVLAIRIAKDLRQQFFEHIQFLPLSFYHEYNVGSLTTRAIGDAGQIASSLNSLLINYLQFPFVLLTSLSACFLISWQLSMILFFGLPLIIIPVTILTKKIKKLSKQILRNQESFTSVLIDVLSGIQTIKVFVMEAFSLKKFHKANTELARLEKKSAKYSLLTRPILHLITTLCLVFIILVGLNFLHMSIAQLLIFAAMLYHFYEPVKKFSEENANIQKGIVSAERMYEVLNVNHQKMSFGSLKLETFNHAIEFRNVGFKYKDHWVLRNLSFILEKGERIAFIGPTGGGKSTIVQLLPRLYDPQEGEIFIDGIPLQKFCKKSLREMISFVPQKPFLFQDSVKENIGFGRDFTDAQIEEAARQAEAHEFILKLPFGYQTILLEGGKNLSGGQQQRLALARAFTKILFQNAPIFILDEATSALDALSEQKIKASLQNLSKDVTQILIAHRLTTIEHATKIIYIDQGSLKAEGSLEKLLRSSKDFEKMWQSYHILQKKV